MLMIGHVAVIMDLFVNRFERDDIAARGKFCKIAIDRAKAYARLFSSRRRKISNIKFRCLEFLISI
jgi:hypothetical protein